MQNRLRNRENNTKKYRCPKSLDLKSADDFSAKQNYYRIDHQQKQAKCNQRYRQGKKYQNWFNKEVQQAQNHCND